MMIQDISPKIFHNEFHNLAPRPQDFVLAFNGRRLYSKIEDRGEAPSVSLPTVNQIEQSLEQVGPGEAGDVEQATAEATQHAAEVSHDENGLRDHYESGNTANDRQDYELVFLFEVDSDRYFLMLPKTGFEDPSPAIPGFAFESWISIRAFAQQDIKLVAATGLQLNKWYRTNRFCGACATPLERSTKERMLLCPNCGNHVYPRINPAVIVAVRNGDKLLMTRYAAAEYRQRALVAGFCEIGETAEQTVAREVMEETGIRVKNVTYYASQPWGFASDLLLGYVADLDGSDCITVDKNELSIAEWVPREQIFEDPDNTSLTRQMVIDFKEGRL